MGKLGGKELNISSDIDVIFIHSSDNGRVEQGGLSLHEYFVRIAREVKRLLNDLTEDGCVHRVDLDLRPEGRSGELTNSVGAMEIYYESWGQVWERQAMIKARHGGGDPAVTEEVITRLRPFVYRKYMDQRAIAEIAGMKDKIDQSLRTKKTAKKTEANIKLGRGGIREIEFIVQSLQLLYGARYPEFTTRSTVEALGIATSLGLISDPHYDDLLSSYLFFRRLENRIQYYQGLQTHDIPESRERKEVLARQLGIEGEDRVAVFERLVARKRERVRSIFDLFFTTDKDAEPVDTFPAPVEDQEAMTDWLDSLSFDRPMESAKALSFLGIGRAFGHASSKSKLLFNEFGPALVAEAAKTSWPDQALLGFQKFVEARASRDQLYDLLQNHRSLIVLLTTLFATSESLTQTLVRQPYLFDRLVGPDPVSTATPRRVIKNEFDVALAKGGSAEERLAHFNEVKGYETLKIGLRSVLGLADRFESMGGLTALAEEYVGALTRLVEQEVGATIDPADAVYTILAGGKLGRREMNFGSDIDMVVFFEEKNSEFVTKLAQSLVTLGKKMTPFGAGYEIDMRLRPDGDKGPLVVSYQGMDSYYRDRGEAWERLALVGVRPIAGDHLFGKKVMGRIDQFLIDPPLTPAAYNKIALIRDRIIREKVKPGALDIKFGRGGLIEIEFICQFLAMELPEGRSGRNDETPFTMTMLGRAKKEGWLPKEDATALEQAYLVYRAVEDALRLDTEKSVNVSPQKGAQLNRIALRANLAGVGPERFVETVNQTRETVREIYDRYIDQRRTEPAE
jgi:glutamate-ammonia-ligase adenylyltransferase